MTSTELPLTETALRACLIRLLHERAADTASLRHFKGHAHMFFQQGKRARTVSLSGSFDPAWGMTGTLPEILSKIAWVLATPHGHVMCHTLLHSDTLGFSGIAVIGSAAFWPEEIRSLLAPQHTLAGVLVHLDGRSKVITYNVKSGVLNEDETLADQLSDIVEATWQVADTLENMRHTPLTDEALTFAHEIMETDHSLDLGYGRRTPIAGAPGPQMRRGFLDGVAAVAAAAGIKPAELEPERRKTHSMIIGDVRDVVANMTSAQPDVTDVPFQYRQS